MDIYFEFNKRKKNTIWPIWELDLMKSWFRSNNMSGYKKKKIWIFSFEIQDIQILAWSWECEMTPQIMAFKIQIWDEIHVPNAI